MCLLYSQKYSLGLLGINHITATLSQSHSSPHGSGDSHWPISVIGGVLQIFADLGQKDLHFLHTPPKSPLRLGSSQDGQTESVHAAGNVLITPQTNLLVLGVFGPPVRWPLVFDLDNVHEPGRGKLVLVK